MPRGAPDVLGRDPPAEHALRGPHAAPAPGLCHGRRRDARSRHRRPAIFSVIHGVLLKPLPNPHSERLVLIQEAAPLAGQDGVGVSIREFYDYREQLHDVEGLVEFHDMSFDLLERGEPDRVTTGVVSANFFDVLGVHEVDPEVPVENVTTLESAPGRPS